MNGISTVRLAELRRVRSYYAIRNQVHFDKHNYGSYMLFRTNSILFVVKAVLSSLFRDRSVAHLRAVLAALFDGEKGRLGLNKDYPL